MSIYKPMDSKREEFRKYLERTGVMDALTKALVALYEETDKPEDALAFVRGHLGGAAIDRHVRALERENKELRAKLEQFATHGFSAEEAHPPSPAAAQAAAAAATQAAAPAGGPDAISEKPEDAAEEAVAAEGGGGEGGAEVATEEAAAPAEA